jgi:hypothetical protein
MCDRSPNWQLPPYTEETISNYIKKQKRLIMAMCKKKVCLRDEQFLQSVG